MPAKILANGLDKVSASSSDSDNSQIKSESVSVDSGPNLSRNALRLACESGVTDKQLRAQKKHSLYERGWQRFN